MEAQNIYYKYSTDKNPISYKCGETAIFNIWYFMDGEPYKMSNLCWSLRSDGGYTKKGKENDVDNLMLKIPINHIGFTHISVYECDENSIIKGDGLRFDGGIGADVLHIPLLTPVPKDFNSRWDSWIRELKNVDNNPYIMQEVFEDVPVTHRAFDIKIKSIGNYPSSGYFTYPKKAKVNSLPIYLQCTGYGVHSAIKIFKDAIVLHLNAHGIENGREPEYYIEFGKTFSGNYAFNNEENENPETCYFKKMILRDLQGLYFLKNHPFWNKKEITVMGGSQGALQAIALAAHDNDITKCILEIPWMSNICSCESGYIRGWRPENREGLYYFDEAVQATRVTCDTEIVTGLGDYVSPPSTVAALFNSLASENKKITFGQNMVHQSIPENLDGYTIQYKNGVEVK